MRKAFIEHTCANFRAAYYTPDKNALKDARTSTWEAIFFIHIIRAASEVTWQLLHSAVHLSTWTIHLLGFIVRLKTSNRWFKHLTPARKMDRTAKFKFRGKKWEVLPISEGFTCWLPSFFFYCANYESPGVDNCCTRLKQQTFNSNLNILPGI